MSLIYHITVETKPAGGKWERACAETSLWASAETMLRDFVNRYPDREVRLVAEMVPFEPADAPTERINA